MEKIKAGIVCAICIIAWDVMMLMFLTGGPIW